MTATEDGLRQARALAELYAREVRAHFGDRVRAIWLYGSAARGDWASDSDIDVLVLLDAVGAKDSEWLVSHAYRMGLLERELLLQPVMLSAGEFQHLSDRERRFAQEVTTQGVLL